MEKMMKKLMFALIAALFCSSLMAQVLIYDYSASFKRIDVKSPVKVSYRPAGESRAYTYGLDSPKVASDKFTGYMVIEACYNCGGTMELSAEGGHQWPGNPAVVYIKRNGNKNAVYRAIGRFEAAMFGAKAGIAHVKDGRGGVDYILVNPSKFTDALGFLSYNINASGNVDFLTSTKVNGFMGMGHTGMNIEGLNNNNWWNENALDSVPEHWLDLAFDYDTVDHAGFGKVKVLKTELDCLDEQSCYVVNNLSGSMLGGFNYTGYCSDFLLDVCGYEAYWFSRLAPISGTFTLKLNNKLTFSSKEYKNNTFADAEKTIEAVFSGTKYADPLETEQFNWWLDEVLDQPALKDYYFWYSVAAKGSVINAKNDYKAVAGAITNIAPIDMAKVTKVEIVDDGSGNNVYKVTYRDSSDAEQTVTFAEWDEI